ncbi:MAG: prolyl-tRNA synthetase associated domain-containing protein [Pseudomonadota bacterium]
MDQERLLFARFEELGIASETLEHDATYRVEESRHLAETLPGGRSKSLLVADKDQQLILITARGSTRVDLKKVGDAVGIRGRLSFAKGQVMEEVLNVSPGHLTPFALVNDRQGQIACMVLDAELLREPCIWAHPLRNTASTAVSSADLERFAAVHARRVLKLDLAAG